MLALPGFEPKIERASLEDFFRVGNLLGDRTWIKGVALLPAATVLTWDLNERTLGQRQYWSTDEIKPLPVGTDPVELAEELGRPFHAAVERRSTGRTGVTLSGGLDSRAILAAMSKNGVLHAVTIGTRGCADERLARRAAKVKGAAHHAWELSAAGWLRPRIEGVWSTDGELNLLHMHITAVLPRVRELFDIALDGCGANGVIGDTWIEMGIATQAEYIDTRTRRFLILGPAVLRGHIEERFPFMDNKFVELCLAAPDELKQDNALYKMMLLKTFPEYYERIPWQKTGEPIRWPGPYEGRPTLKDRIRWRLHRYGLYKPRSRAFYDYAGWIRQEPARSTFQSVLGDRSALYPEYLSPKEVEAGLAKHFAGEDRAQYLCGVLTFELWLRQIFNRTTGSF
jgi:asparagine synthase (glutamine-hydrolysing)